MYSNLTLLQGLCLQRDAFSLHCTFRYSTVLALLLLPISLSYMIIHKYKFTPLVSTLLCVCKLLSKLNDTTIKKPANG